MVGRVKFEVKKINGEWKTAYSTISMLDVNRLVFLCYGFSVRINGVEQHGNAVKAA